MAYQFTRIAVKIGSNVLARTDGTPDVTRMSALVDQIAELHKAGVEVILISSGQSLRDGVKSNRPRSWTVLTSGNFFFLLWDRRN